ncbi:hypothetical protein BUC_6642 [Burkholderia pseudomallei 576]|nr:hypothetical protein BUC_6642 [Burkholderia pseudomallei 576]
MIFCFAASTMRAAIDHSLVTAALRENHVSTKTLFRDQ